MDHGFHMQSDCAAFVTFAAFCFRFFAGLLLGFGR